MSTPNKDGLYYLASPYSHPSKRTMTNRYHTANRIAASMIEEGYLLITPIASSVSLCKDSNLSGSFMTWARLDLELVARSDGVIVLDMPGWQQSIGVTAEILRATDLQLPVWLRRMDGTFVQLVMETANEQRS